MSAIFLYHAVGIRGYDHVRTYDPEGQDLFTIAPDPLDCRCSSAASGDVISRGQFDRGVGVHDFAEIGQVVGLRPPERPKRRREAPKSGRVPSIRASRVAQRM